MLMLIRHLLAIAALPFMVTVLIPTWIAGRYGVDPELGRTMATLLLQLAGVGLLVVGIFLFVQSLRRFAVDGKGTLAPWDPPRALVVRGPYRYVRNPMISGVLFILFGEALALLSEPHFMWATTFLVVNAVVIPLFEEPQLKHRFGAAYEDYCRNVPRLVPRLSPWDPTTPQS